MKSTRQTRSKSKDPPPKATQKSAEPRKAKKKEPEPVPVKRSSSVAKASRKSSEVKSVKSNSKPKPKAKDVIVDVKLEAVKPEPATSKSREHKKPEPKLEQIAPVKQEPQTMFDFENYVKQEFSLKAEAPSQQVFNSQHTAGYKFTPSMSQVSRHKTPEKPKAEPQKVEPAASDLLNLKASQFLNRKEAQARAGITVEE